MNEKLNNNEQMARAMFGHDLYPEGFVPICTCPSGDGSLRHPCPEHPARADVQLGGMVRLGDQASAQGCDELRARTDGERAAYMEGLEEGKKIAARQPVGAVPQGCDACDRTGIRQNDEGRNIFCPDCELGRACAGDTRQPVGEPVEMSPEFTDTARAAIAWVLWHHQGGSSPVGQPLRFSLGMGQHDRMTDHQIAEAKRFAAWAGATSEGFHHHSPASAVDLGRWSQRHAEDLEQAINTALSAHAGSLSQKKRAAISAYVKRLLIDSKAVGK